MDGRRARALLGVDTDAGSDEIRRAFRARALITHPDRGGDRVTFGRSWSRSRHSSTSTFRAVCRHVRSCLARPRIDVYDSEYRCRPKRGFDDVLRVAIASQAG